MGLRHVSVGFGSVQALHTDPSLFRTGLPLTGLAVYLTVDPAQPPTPLENMKRELSGMMQAAGYRVVYGDPRAPLRNAAVSALVVMDLRGRCGMPAGNYRVEPSATSGADLAETAVSNGVVLPFSHINCGNLTRLVSPVLAEEVATRRDFLCGRAMARVAVHELYHVMLGSLKHRREGIAKPSFSVADLLDEYFDFNCVTLALLRQRAGQAESTTPRQ